ncbi:MAG TPA: Dabb family protein [Vicinamibacteria bacterium]|nr:Dabb family protein [Vicinamibacteria bacterium]
MKRTVALASLLLLAPVASWAQKALAHDVYFSLNDASQAARAELVAACHKYLTGYEGTLSFSVGVVAAELARPVNDRDFDVALHVTFASRAAHDAYQEHPRHKQFIAEQQKNWKKVRVFDSMVEVVK